MIALSSKSMLVSSLTVALVLLAQGSASAQDAQSQISSYISDVIQKPGMWESMYNREVGGLFEALYGLVKGGDDLDEIHDAANRNFIILRLVQRKLRSLSAHDIAQSFAQISGSSEQQAIGAIEATCGQLDAQFGPHHKEITRLQTLSKDNVLINKLAGYNDLFMKLVVAYSACVRVYTH